MLTTLHGRSPTRFAHRHAPASHSVLFLARPKLHVLVHRPRCHRARPCSLVPCTCRALGPSAPAWPRAASPTAAGNQRATSPRGALVIEDSLGVLEIWSTSPPWSTSAGPSTAQSRSGPRPPGLLEAGCWDVPFHRFIAVKVLGLIITGGGFRCKPAPAGSLATGARYMAPIFWRHVVGPRETQTRITRARTSSSTLPTAPTRRGDYSVQGGRGWRRSLATGLSWPARRGRILECSELLC